MVRIVQDAVSTCVAVYFILWYEARLETKPLHNDTKRPSEKYSDGLF
jgi:hypothetical protein